MFFFFLFFYTRIVKIVPIVDRNISSSYVGQKITLSLGKPNFCDFYLSQGPKSHGRIFYSEQLSGFQMTHKKNYSRKNEFPIHYFAQAPIPRSDLSFKVNSNFTANDALYLKLRFTNNNICSDPSIEPEESPQFIHTSLKSLFHNRLEMIIHHLKIDITPYQLIQKFAYYQLITFAFIAFYIIKNIKSKNRACIILFILIVFGFIQSIANALSQEYFSNNIALYHSLFIAYVYFYNFKRIEMMIIYIFCSYFYPYGFFLQAILIFITYFYDERTNSIGFDYIMLIISSDLWVCIFKSYNILDFIILYYFISNAFPSFEFRSVIFCLLVIFSVVGAFFLDISFHDPSSIHNIDEISEVWKLKITIQPYINNFSFLGETLEKIKAATEKKYTLDNCKFCNFKPPRPAGSTPRDLVIVQIGKKPKAAKSALFSLRSTGCKASIVVTLKKEDVLEPEFEKQLNDCGIFAVHLDHYYKHWYLEYMKIVRFPMYAEFLSKYYGQFDRICYFDSFDTAFQSDPFSDDIKKDVLYISPEFNPVRNNLFIQQWMSRIGGFDYGPYMNREVVCSGIFIGYADIIIKLGNIMKAMYNKGNDFITNDQGLFDCLYFSGVFDSAGLNPTIDLRIPSAGYILPRVPLQPLGSIIINNVTVVLVHHLNRNDKYVNSVKEICGIVD